MSRCPSCGREVGGRGRRHDPTKPCSRRSDNTRAARKARGESVADGRPAVRMGHKLGEEVARWIDAGREGEALEVLTTERERMGF